MGSIQSYFIGGVLVVVAMLAFLNFYVLAATNAGVYNSTGLVASTIGDANTSLRWSFSQEETAAKNMKIGVNSNTTGSTSGLIAFADIPFQVVGQIYSVVSTIFDSLTLGTRLIGAVLSFGSPLMTDYISLGITVIIGFFLFFSFINFIQARKPL